MADLPTPEPPRCCGRPMLHVGETVTRTDSMGNPPRTFDRWLITRAWQCAVTADDRRCTLDTTNDPAEVPTLLGGSRG